MGSPFRGTSGPPSHVPELELDVPSVPAPRAKPRPVEAPQGPLELAVDPRVLVQERASLRSPVQAAPLRGLTSPAQVAFDGRLLADYGEAPRHPMLLPLYAYGVLKRRRALRLALAEKREEAGRASDQVDQALLAFADRARATAEKADEYVRALADLHESEDALRSREGELALEQVAQKARLSQVASRIANLEADLVETQTIRLGVAKARTRVDTARAERVSLEHWFKRQSGARAAAVREARRRLRGQMLAFARRALSDHAVLGSEFDASRQEIGKLELTEAAALRDVQVHEAALGSYDARAVRKGFVVTAALVLVLVVAPVVWRAVRVVEPPIPRARAVPARAG